MWGRIREQFLTGSRHLLIIIFLPIILLAVVIATFIGKEPGYARESNPIAPASLVPAGNSDLLLATAPDKGSFVSAAEITVHPAQNGIIRRAPQKGVYYVVARSLENQQKAEEYAQSMLSGGYYPRLLGKIGKYYFVALDTFLTEKEAFSAVRRLRESSVAGEAWVYHLP